MCLFVADFLLLRAGSHDGALRPADGFVGSWPEDVRRSGASDELFERADGDLGIAKFFGGEPMKKILPTHQHFDFPGLAGRLLSSSYIPEASHPRYQEMLEELKRLFYGHQQRDRVTFEYDTLVYYGRLL